MTIKEQESAPAAQPALLGIEQAKQAFRRTAHPGAQWFGDAGLGLFIHWGISAVHGGIDISRSMMANTPWNAKLANRSRITPAEFSPRAGASRRRRFHRAGRAAARGQRRRQVTLKEIVGWL